MKRELDSLVTQMHAGGIHYDEAVREFKRRFITEVLAHHRGNQCKAARELSMHRNTLRRTIAELKLDTDQIRNGLKRPPRAERPMVEVKQVGPQLVPTGGPVCIQKGFRWDDCDAYLFDIDGTLLHAHGGVHTRSFSSSVEAVLGHPLSLDSVPVHGSTDTAILRDAFLHAGIPEEVWQPRLEEILERMRTEVMEQRSLMSVTVMPGVLPMLRHLKDRGKRLGVATGNLEQIGWLKIEVAGLRDWFTFGGFSDRHAVRGEMIANALVVGECAGASVCVVGDTPSDISAARANGLPTIAVATGMYSYEDLLQHQPEVCTTTLEALLAVTAKESA